MLQVARLLAVAIVKTLWRDG